MDNGTARNGHVDARRLVVPLWLAMVITASAVGSTLTVAGFYWSLSNQISGLVETMNGMKHEAESFRGAVKSDQAALRGEVVTRRDLEVLCLQFQVSNRGWRCPFAVASGPDLTHADRRAAVQPKGMKQ